MNIQFYVMKSVYFLALTGIFLLFQNNIIYLLRSLLWPIKKMYSGNKNMLHWHIESILLVITDGKHIQQKVTAFIVFTFLIFISASSLLVRTFGVRGITLAALLTAMPYLGIRARLYVKQIKSSFEGEMLIEELVNQYKMCGRNIYQTIDASILSIPEGNISKNALYQLKLKLNTFGSEAELKKALKRFTLNWNSTWARMVADNIYNAVWEHVDVLCGLENLLEECKNINKGVESNKRDALEAEVIVKFICPLFFIILICMVRFMFGFSWEKMVSYIFIDKRGLILLTSLILVHCFNIAIFPVLGKRKYDF